MLKMIFKIPRSLTGGWSLQVKIELVEKVEKEQMSNRQEYVLEHFFFCVRGVFDHFWNKNHKVIKYG